MGIGSMWCHFSIVVWGACHKLRRNILPFHCPINLTMHMSLNFWAWFILITHKISPFDSTLLSATSESPHYKPVNSFSSLDFRMWATIIFDTVDHSSLRLDPWQIHYGNALWSDIISDEYRRYRRFGNPPFNLYWRIQQHTYQPSGCAIAPNKEWSPHNYCA